MSKKTGLKWDTKRIEAIRKELLKAGYKAELLSRPGGTIPLYSMVQYSIGEYERCMLPSPDVPFSMFQDTPQRAAECLESLIRHTGKAYLELGPLTKREGAYAARIKFGRSNAVVIPTGSENLTPNESTLVKALQATWLLMNMTDVRDAIAPSEYRFAKAAASKAVASVGQTLKWTPPPDSPAMLKRLDKLQAEDRRIKKGRKRLKLVPKR